MTDNDLYDLMRSIVSAVTGISDIIPGDDNEESPSGPYASIKIGSARGRRGQANISTANVGPVASVIGEVFDVEHDIKPQLTVDVSVNFYRADALENASLLIECNKRPDVSGLLFTAAVGWRGTTNPNDLTAIQSKEREERSQITVTLLYEGSQKVITNAIYEVPIDIITEDPDREILTFNGTDAFATLDTPFVVGAGEDFSITVDFALTDVASSRVLFGESTGGLDSRVYINTSGIITWAIPDNAGTGLDFIGLNPLGDVADGEIRQAVFSRMSGEYRITAASNTAAAVRTAHAVNYEFIGKASSFGYFPGQILRFALTNDTTAASQTYALQSGSTTTETSVEGDDTITFSNVVDADWEEYVFKSNPDRWVSMDGTKIIVIA